MRARLFRRLIRAAEKHELKILQDIELRVLMLLAAKSFDMPKGCSDSSLEGYALFTKKCMEEGSADPERLYNDAYELGSRIRKITGLSSDPDLERLIFLLYRNIGIDMSGSIRGTFTVDECYFSNYYTADQCALMSNVDSGIIGGICLGGHLEFSERITEGCGRCRACFDKGRSIG